LIVAALAFTMTGCGSSTASAVSELTAESKPATQYTIDANQEVYALLDFEDTAEFENATKGLLASPDTANPSLWRDTQLNHIYGLFEVTDGIYQVRDGNAWAEYIMESLALYGDKADVVFQSHNWPHWGNDTIQEYMTNTAAVYKFINDQTLLYINEGYTETEIANMIQLPEELEKVWYTRQYYGTVSHNSKAVYEKYMGWYDANPVHLAELTPSDYAQKLVEYFGDTDAVLEKAKEDFEKGEYQWVAQITNTLVFADPENMDARYLCADALEQLGYQAESGLWRNAYLCAAQELRNGTNTDDATRSSGNGDVFLHMTPDMILDYLGIFVDTTKISDLTFTANIILPEGNYVLRVKNGVLLYQKDAQDADADVTWTTKRAGLLSIVQKNAENVAALIEQEGDETCLTRLMDAVYCYVRV
jgi:alkyl sulfatase BDS1-like metallo-beta-lactamase superfamily hydrolase